MTSWMHQLGKHFLKEGALTYLISDEEQCSWNGEEKTKQKMDMVALFPEHLRLIELKETEARHNKSVKFTQIERYYFICRDAKYKTEFWVYTYWSAYKIITGVRMDRVDNLQFYALERNGNIEFYASIGVNPATRIRKKVDFKLKINETVETTPSAFVE